MTNSIKRNLCSVRCAAVLGSLLLVAPIANAAVDLDYDNPSSNLLTITFDDTVVFTPTVTGTFSDVRVVFDNIYTTDSGISFNPVDGSSTLTLGGSLSTGGFYNINAQAVQTTDLVLSFDDGASLGLTSGVGVTLSSGLAISTAIPAPLDEPDNLGGMTEITMFLVDSSYNRISGDVTVALVPEPGTFALVLSGMLGLAVVAFRRSRK